MKLKIAPPSRLAVDVAASGALKALAHDRSFVVDAPPFSLEVGDGEALDVAVAFEFAADRLLPHPDDLNAADRMLLLRNLQGNEVLDSKRYPSVAFAGRYSGDWRGGKLRGRLTLRGKASDVEFLCRLEKTKDGVAVQGEWQGKLTDLGIRPFKALLGAIRLKNWARLHFNVRFVQAGA